MTDPLFDRPLKNRLGIRPGVVTILTVQMEICEKHCCSIEQLKGRSRERAIAWRRHEAMYEAYLRTGKSLREIGNAFGNRHKQVVFDAINAHRARLGRPPFSIPKSLLKTVKTRPELLRKGPTFSPAK